jgi:hypothetical protein
MSLVIRTARKRINLMNILLTDLIVRLSEDTRQVTFLIRKKDQPNELLRFYSFNIDDYGSENLLANELGVGLVAFLKTTHKDIFPFDETADSANCDVSDKSSFYEVRLLIDRIGENSDIDDLKSIDILLEDAATAGDEDAVKYLVETWPKLRNVFVRRLERKGMRPKGPG